MPASKRPRDDIVQNQPVPKRGVGATEAPSDDNPIVKILRKCLQKQSDYIACVEKVLVTWEPRFKRLQPHLQYQLKIEKDRVAVTNATKEQIKNYEKKIYGQNQEETILKIIVKKMEDKEDKLDKVAHDVGKYKGYEIFNPKKIVRIVPVVDESLNKELNDALQRIPTISTDSSKTETLPKLEKNDLDDINWPEKIRDWSKYSLHWSKKFDEATKCREQNETILNLVGKLEESVTSYNAVQTRKNDIEVYDKNRNPHSHYGNIQTMEQMSLKERLEQLIRESFEKKASVKELKAKEKDLEASKKQREDLLEFIQNEVNAKLLKCSVCVQPLTNGEQSLRCPQLFGSCGHTLCASCMPQVKARIPPYQWTCHECQTPSDKILTNWILMKLIKEIPGQPQREAVRVPDAVPIVPAPWRLQRRPNLELQFQALLDGVDVNRINRHVRELVDRVFPVAPVPIAPAPVVAPQPIQVLAAQLAPAVQAAPQLAPAPEEDEVEVEEEEEEEEEEENEDQEIEDEDNEEDDEQ